METFEAISLSLGILTVLATVISALFIRFIFAPVCEIEVKPRWSDKNSEFLIVGFRFKNTSRVRVENPEVTTEIAFYSPSNVTTLGPRQSDNGVLEPESELPNQLLYSKESRIFSGESIYRELMVRRPSEASIAFISMRVRIDLGSFRRAILLKKQHWSQTSTSILTVDASSPNKAE